MIRRPNKKPLRIADEAANEGSIKIQSCGL
jgi:hypothetical protein